MPDTTIAEVAVTLVEQPAQPPFRWREGLPGSDPETTAARVTITTAGGHRGSATGARGIIVEDLVQRRVRPDLIGRDALDRELIWHRLWELDRIEEFPIYLIGLIDTALWDLAGHIFGQPVHRLLGGFRTSIQAYASTVTYGSTAEYLDVVDQCMERGFTAIKLHAWGDVRADAELAAAVRDRVGPDVPLMYDGSAGFDLADAVRLGRVLAELDYTWYEEPMREFSVRSYQQLAERVDVPLLVGETSDGAHWNMGDFIFSGAATAVRTSAAYKAGITGALRIAHLAEAFGLRAEVHGMGAANIHLCMAIPNTSYYEALVWGNPIRTDPCVGADGLVQAPTEPGIGTGLGGPAETDS